MAALEEAVASLQQAVNDANSRFQNVGELENALAAERERYDTLVSTEAEEDVLQDQELNDARATTDAALAQLNSVASVLTGLTDQVNTLGRTASEATADATGSTDTASTDAVAPDAAPTDATSTDTTAPDAVPTMTAPDDAASAGNSDVNQVETTAPTDTTTDTLNEAMPNAPTPGDTPADVGTTAAAADSEETGSADVTPTDTGAADSQVADNAAPGPSAVDNANQNPDTSTDPTDVSNMRPNL